MGVFTVQTRINAPQDQVWDVLADLGNIYKWDPLVSHSYSTSQAGQGEGATRHCDIRGSMNGYLEERAFDWREGEGYKIEVYETSFPVKRSIVSFSVRPDRDGAVVEVTPDYQMKYGPLGALIDWLMVKRQFRTGMEGLLSGLKQYVETGREAHPLKVPEGREAA